MCQISSPSAGRFASKPLRCRFSRRKYSDPPVPSFHRRWTFRLVLTSGREMVPPLVTLGVGAAPWWVVHHADGCAGTSPPPFHDPPPIRHQLPMPSDVSSVS